MEPGPAGDRAGDGGGGELVRTTSDGGYSSVSGAKGWRWREASDVRDNAVFDIVDYCYYEQLCSDAVDTINRYGDYNRFVDLSTPYISPNDESNTMLDRLTKGQ